MTTDGRLSHLLMLRKANILKPEGKNELIALLLEKLRHSQPKGSTNA